MFASCVPAAPARPATPRVVMSALLQSQAGPAAQLRETLYVHTQLQGVKTLVKQTLTLTSLKKWVFIYIMF